MTVEHEGDSDTNCSQNTWKNPQEPGKVAWLTGD